MCHFRVLASDANQRRVTLSKCTRAQRDAVEAADTGVFRSAAAPLAVLGVQALVLALPLSRAAEAPHVVRWW
jgi:hypothetical protein